MKKNFRPSIALRGGAYSIAVTAIVLAIVIGVNLLVSALPAGYTKYDISSSKLYSITSNTKVVVNNLEKDVTIYWIVQSGEEDEVLEILLSKYDSLSDHISVVTKNPDVYPTFAAQYTDETVANNSLVVECGDKSRYIAYSDIYLQEITNIYSYSYTTSFDGEGAITSAIDYVVSDDLPKLYTLTGHGESDLPSTFQDSLEKENYEVESFSLLNVDEVPEDADCVVIYAPTSDLSTDEVDMLRDYTQNGGKLLVMSGLTEDGVLENLYTLLSDYGVTADDGVVIEEDRNYYGPRYPYVLMPEMTSSDITDSLIDENYYALMPICIGLRTSSATSAVTSLMTTSDTSFSKVDGYNISTYEKEENDTDGPFSVAVSIECDNDGQIVWFSSSAFLEDAYNAYSSGANQDLAMNALSSLVGEREAIAIRSKSLNYNYLTISESTGSLLRGLLIGAFPLLYLGIGIAVFAVRRKRQNEEV